VARTVRGGARPTPTNPSWDDLSPDLGHTRIESVSYHVVGNDGSGCVVNVNDDDVIRGRFVTVNNVRTTRRLILPTTDRPDSGNHWSDVLLDRGSVSRL
jgi:hypothetical protein